MTYRADEFSGSDGSTNVGGQVECNDLVGSQGTEDRCEGEQESAGVHFGGVCGLD
jgi:hypothetical protein